MRTFVWFLGLLALGFAAMGAFAYPAWLWLWPHFHFALHRVGGRIGMLALLIGFVLAARHLGLADRASLGYGLARRAFLTELARALGLGVALMLVVVAVMIALKLRSLLPGVTLDAGTLLHLAGQGLASGLAVALIEETFLRGAMWSGIERESGAIMATVLTALVYAATHFIARYHIAPEAASWWSGLDLLAGSLREFAHPFANADAFLCLFAVGVLLGTIRAATGNIAACIGLHAGWVWIITCTRGLSGPDPTRELAFLLSHFDGFLGWLVLAWTIVITPPLVRFYRRRATFRGAAVRLDTEGARPGR